MKIVTIGDILTESQIKEVKEYIDRQYTAGHRANETMVVAGLKEILGKWKKELAKKGIDSNYLAYAIAYEMGKQQ